VATTLFVFSYIVAEESKKIKHLHFRDKINNFFYFPDFCFPSFSSRLLSSILYLHLLEVDLNSL
jgi:hypothetical protein